MKILVAVLLCSAFCLVAVSVQAQTKKDRQLAHIVFFKLKDNSTAAHKKLVAACQKYLSGHDGEVYFSVGTRAEELKREVNDQNFDVALHIIFDSKAAHDKYQDHPRHHEFIKENKDNWAGVRVFDSYLAPSVAAKGAKKAASR
jgi:hypothetical protein